MKTTLSALYLKSPRLLWYALIGGGLWLAATVVATGARSLRLSGKAAAAIGEYERIRNEAGQSSQDGQERIQALTKNNLFTPLPEQAQVPKSQAILGNAVLIGDQWYQEGQTVQGFEIASIGPNSVTLHRDGQEHCVKPFEMEVNYGQAAGAPSAPSGAPPDRGRESREGDRRTRGRGGPSSSPDGSRMDMRARMENLTPEQRQEMYERFRNASPEERERMREEYMRGGNN